MKYTLTILLALVWFAFFIGYAFFGLKLQKVTLSAALLFVSVEMFYITYLHSIYEKK